MLRNTHPEPEASVLPAHTACLQTGGWLSRAAHPHLPHSRPPGSERSHIRVGRKDTENPEPAFRCFPQMTPATSDAPASLQGGGGWGHR